MDSRVETPSYFRIIRLAIPIILANSATPLLGLADTAVVGNFAHTVDLGGVALGALVFSFLYWGFGFLRMSTTGFIAQAGGRQDPTEMVVILWRALLLAFAIGCALILFQWPLREGAMSLLGASAAVEGITRDYIHLRIWGAPACLGNYVLTGFLIGRGQGRQLLLMQLLLNGVNIALDILFAGYFHLGAPGIAVGTALAEWITLLAVGSLVWRQLQREAGIHWRALPWPRILDRAQLRRTLGANGDIMIRTVLLLTGFAVFTDQGARFGDTILAGNHILLQFISFSAFFLDGFAFVTESQVGQAAGNRRIDLFDATVKRSSVLAAITALLLSLGLWLGGALAISLLTDIAPVRTTAIQYLPFACLYVLLSFMAFQLDGIFIGATGTRAMRNGSILSLAVFLLVSFPLIHRYGNAGLWTGFILFVVARAISLGIWFPGLRRRISSPY